MVIVSSEEAKKRLKEQVQKLEDTQAKSEALKKSRQEEAEKQLKIRGGEILAKCLESGARMFCEEGICVVCKKETPLRESGFCFDCHEKAVAEATKSQRDAATLDEVLGGHGISETYSFSKFIQVQGNTEALKLCRSFNPYETNLFLTGETGTGKTHLLYAVAGDQHLKGYKTIVKTVKQLRRDLDDRRFKGEAAIVQELSTCEVLSLDEIGFGEDSQKVAASLCEILDNRHRTGRNGLIITSNHTIDGLQGFFGDRRLTSRLYGMCKELVLEPKDKNGQLIDFRKFDLSKTAK